MSLINLRITSIAATTAVLAAAPVAHAQRVLEVPFRTGVGADALAPGSVAVFWNPASIGLPAGRGEALILDSRGPQPTGLDGLAAAGMYRMGDRMALAVGLQYTGIADIERTTISPLPSDGAVSIDVSETTFSLGAVRQTAERTSVGAAFRFTRVSPFAGGDNVLAFGVGANHVLRPRAEITPRVAAGAFLDGDGVDWFTGASAARPVGSRGWSVGAEWGMRGSPRFVGVEHRLAVTGSLAERLRLGLGVSVEPGADGRTVEPAGSISLIVARYVVGVVREELPNELGAVHQFRLSVHF